LVSTELIIWLSLTVIGFAILLVAFFAGHDVAAGDVSGDFGGADAGGGDGGAGATSPGLSPLSLPMIAAFLATAGATGAGFNLSGFDTGITSLIAIAIGSLVAFGAFIFVAKFLGEAQASSLVHEKEYEGKTGVVTETIPDQGVGAIAMTVRGTRTVISARSDHGRIATGAEVLVKRVANSIAVVEELKAS
jgi:membrane protein implicated in regulation of membrane protease activity